MDICTASTSSRLRWICTTNTGRPLMGRRKGEKIMKIPAEFEDILRGVELTEREKRFLRWITSWDDHTMQNMRTVVEKVRSTLSTLQAENETLRAELKSKVDLVFQQAKELDRRHLLLEEQEAELEQVKRERDAALCRLDVVYET
nr:MAG TPA: nuclear pore complex protein [Caudoviricetes sp.]